VPGIPRHYIRVNPGDPNHAVDGDPNLNMVTLTNRPPGARFLFPAKEIVDAGFLELVRYGIRSADDPIIQDSLRVVDAVLKVDTPFGPCWRRFNHDGYGQRDDGSAYKDWGTGRAWPMLTGERGHYELAAGRKATPYLTALEKFAQGVGLIPEQIWDEPDLPSKHLHLGRGTGAAVPLLWAHAEYLKLQRSAVDARVFDLVEPVFERYAGGARDRRPFEVWKFNRQAETAARGGRLCIQAAAPFLLHWTSDEWQHANDTQSQPTALGIDHVELDLPDREGQIRFTFLWLQVNRWEGKDYSVRLRARAEERAEMVGHKEAERAA
jgi:glucoamylase